jgi:hypothetical protein
MDMGYAVKGKYKGQNWTSQIFDDAQDMDDLYRECLKNKDYTALKECKVYIHYEEIENFK